MKKENSNQIRKRLIEIRRAILDENVSYSELCYLQDHVDYIPEDDFLLLEWAGVEKMVNY
ncbi:hypothetical protein DSECCO2_650010 [anaerobic digester metagenome]